MKQLPEDLKLTFSSLKEVINRLNLHNGIGWVSLDPLLKELKAYLKYVYAPNYDLHGLAIPDNGIGWNTIYINSADPHYRQRETIGHESYHIYEFENGRPHISFDCGVNTAQELGCKCAAAIFYVPLSELVEMSMSDLNPQQIAGELKVPVDLVILRWEIAKQLENLGVEA